MLKLSINLKQQNVEFLLKEIERRNWVEIDMDLRQLKFYLFFSIYIGSR